jgi:hypothetical protein
MQSAVNLDRPPIIPFFWAYAILLGGFKAFQVFLMSHELYSYLSTYHSFSKSKRMEVVITAIFALWALSYLVAPFLPKRKITWVYSLVLITLGLTNCISLPFSLPIMLFWLTERCRLYYFQSPSVEASLLQPGSGDSANQSEQTTEGKALKSLRSAAVGSAVGALVVPILSVSIYMSMQHDEYGLGTWIVLAIAFPSGILLGGLAGVVVSLFRKEA